MANPGGLSISAGLYARPALTSPMAQLTCLLPSHSSENITHIGQKVPPSTTPVTKGRYFFCLPNFFIKSLKSCFLNLKLVFDSVISYLKY